MRLRILGVVAVVAVAASVAVVAVASTGQAAGLPSYTKGYAKWPKLNKKPIRNEDPRTGHAGTKNVFVSKRKVGKRYPNGAVVVKTIVDPGTKFIGKVAVMRKVNGRWRYIEYTRSAPSRRYTVLAQGALCQSCHMQVRSNDYVFTR
ncbi:MAG TPA: cytochrome P460 family protein [Gaiellaceae bacterium]|nr:cytochrome P460 family protein [Gaiellaceae bacterium]